MLLGVVRSADVLPAYGRAVLGREMVVITVVEAGRRDGSNGGVGKGVRWSIVRDDRLRWVRPVVEVGRMFPTRVGKLRHGPLCEAAGGGGRTLDDDGGGGEERGGWLVSSLEAGSTRARAAGGLLGIVAVAVTVAVAASKQVCDERPDPDPGPAPGQVSVYSEIWNKPRGPEGTEGSELLLFNAGAAGCLASWRKSCFEKCLDDPASDRSHQQAGGQATGGKSIV